MALDLSNNSNLEQLALRWLNQIKLQPNYKRKSSYAQNETHTDNNETKAWFTPFDQELDWKYSITFMVHTAQLYEGPVNYGPSPTLPSSR